MVKKSRTKKRKVIKKISHTTKPSGLSLEQWQVTLRKQMAQDGTFRIRNVGTEPIFSTFRVTNTQTEKSYRVVIAGEILGINYCSCPDFSVNTLGTCKHIEHVLHKLRKKRGAKKAFKKGYVPKDSAVTLRYGLKRQIFFAVGINASDLLKKLVKKFFDEQGFLTSWGFEHFDKFVTKADALGDKVHYHEDAISFIANVRDAAFRKKRLAKLVPDGVHDPAFDQLLKTDLYPYQKEGTLFAARTGRCLIADEMGLGKTIEAIAASELMARCFGIEKVLIVCPTSLKYQWKKEIERFTNRSSLAIQGLLPKRHALYQEESFFKITNYDIIHRDIIAINEWAPDLIILDEAQRIKNWKTRLARSIKKLYAPYAIVLTGTPLENRLEELHSIVAFIDQHYLGPLFRFLHTHQLTDDVGKVVGYRNLNQLGKSLKPILIRRKKEDVLLQLPERIEKNYFVEMTSQQYNIHEEYRVMVARIVVKWRHYKFLSEEDKLRLMIALQNMRMVCDNTYLIDDNMIYGNKTNELEIQLQELFEDPNTKVVIFSQWIKMIELVIAMLDVHNWKYVWLHGGVPSKKRGDLIQRFREDPDCRIFLSTQAGGVGLNLQNATTVISLDLPWNPAVLEQRIGRVHRLGQKQPVRVINFITANSIEYGMLSLLEFKQSMFSGVLDNGENEIFLGTSRFNQFMKTVETATEGLCKEDHKFSKDEMEQALEETQSAKEEIKEEVVTQSEEAQKTAFSQESVLNRESIGDFLRSAATFLEGVSNRLDQNLQKEHADKGVSDLRELTSEVRITKDHKTGRPTLQIPLPDNETIEKIVQFTSGLFDVFKKR